MKKLFTYLLFQVSAIAAIAQQGMLQGSVTDEKGLLPGLIVQLDSTAFSAVTDLEGGFSFIGVPYGAYRIRISGLGYQPFNQVVTIDSAQNSTGAIFLSASVLQEVVVRGNARPTESKAINMMRTSGTLMNIVSSEGVAKLPDRNVAEAVQRLPGVVMEADQGEGRFISFRGTPSDWSAALVNGDRMPVADEESKTRAMNFDIFPSSLIDFIAVAKTLSPNMEGDAIGGSANFMTRNPPVKRMLQASAGYGYNAQAGKPIYNAMLAYGNRTKDKKMGFLLGGSLYNRNWATDNYQVHYAGNTDHSLTRLELRDYEGRRSTIGLNGAWDYKFNERVKVYAKGLYGNMQDDEYNRKTMYNWSTGYGQSIKLQNIHNKLLTNFWGAEIGGSVQATPRTSLQWRGATYSNKFRYGNTPFSDKDDPRNGYYVVEFEKAVRFNDFLYLDENGKVTDELNAYSRAKLLNIDSPVPGYGDDYKNIQPRYDNIIPVSASDTQFGFTRAYTETNQTYEKDPIVAQVDLQHKWSSRVTLKLGAKVRLKEGARKVGLELWERNKNYSKPLLYGAYNPEMADEQGGFLQELGTPYSGNMLPFIPKDALDEFVQNLGDT